MIQGLDSDELNNYYLVANYIDALKKYNKLDDAIKYIQFLLQLQLHDVQILCSKLKNSSLKIE